MTTSATTPAPDFDPADPATWPNPPDGRCWFLTCPHEVEQVRNSGRRKQVCDQVVHGLRHSRLNKSLARRGLITVPGPGSALIPSLATSGPAGAEPVAPVTQARTSFTHVMDQVHGQLAGLPGLVDRLEIAARTMANADAAAIEIAGAHRASRQAIDQAEAERDVALAQACTALGEAADAKAAQDNAETIAEQALEAEETALAERDAALAAQAATENGERQQRQRAEAAEQVVSEAESTVEQLRGELDGQRADATRITAELATATAQLAAARDQIITEREHAAAQLAEQVRRAEAAEQVASNAEGAVERLRAELDKVRTDAANTVADLRAQLAITIAQHAAAQQRADTTGQALRAAFGLSGAQEAPATPSREIGPPRAAH